MTLIYALRGGANQGMRGSINLVRVGPTPVSCALQGALAAAEAAKDATAGPEYVGWSDR